MPHVLQYKATSFPVQSLSTPLAAYFVSTPGGLQGIAPRAASRPMSAAFPDDVSAAGEAMVNAATAITKELKKFVAIKGEETMIAVLDRVARRKMPTSLRARRQRRSVPNTARHWSHARLRKPPGRFKAVGRERQVPAGSAIVRRMAARLSDAVPRTGPGARVTPACRVASGSRAVLARRYRSAARRVCRVHWCRLAEPVLGGA